MPVLRGKFGSSGDFFGPDETWALFYFIVDSCGYRDCFFSDQDIDSDDMKLTDIV